MRSAPVKPAWLVVGIALLVGSAASSCWVDTRSTELACTRDSDCTGFAEQRYCDLDIGYCLPATCPPACDTCSVSAKTCTISCGSGGAACGAVRCPPGYDCTIQCTGADACASISCADAKACSITCGSGKPNNPACDNVACGSGPCDVACTSEDACGRIACNDSCQCDVACMVGTNCEAASCSGGCANGSLGCASILPGCSTCP